LFIQKSRKNEKAEKSGTAEKRGKSENFPQKAEEVATLSLSFIVLSMKIYSLF
jgi:hypothetical protein